MAYDEGVAQRLRELMDEMPGVDEKKMFGGIAFMVHGNRCCGVVGSELMVRVGADAYEHALTLAHARKMDFTGRPMKGFVYVGEQGFETDADLKAWIDRGHEFVRTLAVK